MKIITYPTPQAYLAATENWLLEREIDNNLILGLCNAFTAPEKPVADAHFVNVFDNGRIVATSIKTWRKIIVTGYTENHEAVALLAAYYRQQQEQPEGVFGTTYHAQTFASCCGATSTLTINMLVHELRTVNELPLPEGELVMATTADLELLLGWSMQFEVDVNAQPLKTREEFLPYVSRRVEGGDYFMWIADGRPVCMAAVVRKTKNTAIVGLVYTPDALRGKGYATGCVHALSKLLLARGYQSCGLFTDADNPVSNGIYRKIGYLPGTAFTDLSF
jgi:predicted GNAT family acetyltransferase